VRLWLSYGTAAIVGIGTPFFALWVARGTPVVSDPAFAGTAVLVALAIIAGVLSATVPRHWMPIALIISGPLCILGVVMFVALANVGEYFWAWLWVAVGSLAASLFTAYVAGKIKRA
jgi:hypothetical protein